MKVKYMISAVVAIAMSLCFSAGAQSNDDVSRQIKDAVMKVYNEEIDKNPNDYNLIFARANQHYYNGDYLRALDDANSVLRIAPAKEKELRYDTYILRAKIYDARNEVDNEVADLQEATRLNPSSLSCVDLMGKAAYKMNDLDAAEKNFQIILRDNQMNYDALYWLAKVEAKRGNNEKAAEYVDRAVQLFPAESQVYVNRADVLNLMGQYEPAAQDLISALSVGNDDNGALNSLVSMSDEHYDDVIKSLDYSIGKAPRVGMFYYIRAAIAMKHLHYSQALTSFKGIISNNLYETADIYYNTAKCQFELMQFNEALASVNKAIMLDANKAEYNLLKSRIYSAQGANYYTEATAALNQALMLSPDNADAQLAKARLLIAQRKNDEAVTVLNNAIMTNPDVAECLLLRGWVYKYRLRKADIAKNDFEKMLVNGNDMHSLRGFALHELGRADEARQWAKDVIANGILPGGETYYYAAALLSDMDDNNAAYGYMESCLANGFGSLYEVTANEDPYVNLKLVRRHPDFNTLIDRYKSNF